MTTVNAVRYARMYKAKSQRASEQGMPWDIVMCECVKKAMKERRFTRSTTDTKEAQECTNPLQKHTQTNNTK